MTDKEIGKIAFDKFGLQECDEEYTYFILGYKEAQAKQLRIGGVSGSLHCPKCNTVNVIEDNNSDLIWCYECEKCYDS